MITTYDVSSVFSVLFEGQVTKDKDLLIIKYNERKEQRLANVENLNYRADIADYDTLIKNYYSITENLKMKRF